MKQTLTLGIMFLLLSCGPRTGMVTGAQVQDSAFVTAAPFDTLTAWRKPPGQPKTVPVAGYYRSDSTFVAPHARSSRRTKAEMHGSDTHAGTISQ